MSNQGKKVKTHYRGTLDDGTQFDSSYDRGEPLEFTCGAGQMIKGFDAAVVDMQVGEKKTVHIPAADAYGEHNPEMVITFPAEQVPNIEQIEKGMKLFLSTPSGMPVPAVVIDVTPEVLGNIPSIAKGEERSEMEDKNIEALYEKLRAENPGMTINIQPFFGGNQYFAFVMEVYRDIRLVGTPPTSIGKFGTLQGRRVPQGVARRLQGRRFHDDHGLPRFDRALHDFVRDRRDVPGFGSAAHRHSRRPSGHPEGGHGRQRQGAYPVRFEICQFVELLEEYDRHAARSEKTGRESLEGGAGSRIPGLGRAEYAA